MIDKQQALEMKVKGASYATIALMLGVTEGCISSALRPSPEVREIVKKRANHRCENCRAWLKKKGHNHHVRTRHVSIEKYNQAENIKLLCPPCHTTIHKKDRTGRRFEIDLKRLGLANTEADYQTK